MYVAKERNGITNTLFNPWIGEGGEESEVGLKFRNTKREETTIVASVAENIRLPSGTRMDGCVVRGPENIIWFCLNLRLLSFAKKKK